jgi:hypothetical protein
MLHKLLSEYLDSVGSILNTIDNGYVEVWQEEVLNSLRANIRIRIRYVNGFLLEINEAVFIENDLMQHLNYRYHFQNSFNALIFRYDNTPHFPDIENFPHHRHGPLGVDGTIRPDLQKVVLEANLSINEI